MLLFLIFTATVLLGERYIKSHIRAAAPHTLPRTFLKGHVRLEHAENTGFSASRLADRPETVQLVSALAAIVGFLSLIPELIRRRKDGLFQLGAGLFMGGSLANLSDRIFRGSVTDYLRFPTLPWKKIRSLIFNLADLCLFLGTALMLLRILFPKKK
ncbi:MAG: signal peptidase II [Oscillospiraceae bacterium]|nr:signal peptidase II [Oscillospiraceae bacterium]